MIDVDALVKSTLLSCCQNVRRTYYKKPDGGAMPSEYITYQIVQIADTEHSDDEADATMHDYAIDIYTRGDCMSLLAAVRTGLNAAGFHGTTVDMEIYEKETGYYHIPMITHYLDDLTEV